MKNKLLVSLCLCAASLFSQVVGVDTLWKTGPISKRINLVIMGDGYTTAELPQFKTNAINVSNYLLNAPPFVYYKNYFNVFAIECQSPQSGVTHLGVATDVTEPASPIMSVTNLFDTRFDNYGTHRNIYSMNPSAVYAVLSANFPNYDQVIILGNSPEYGGAGGAYAVSSIHPSSYEIVAHEMGHSFAGLADEYWAGTVFATEKPNMTANNNPATAKWSQWIGSNQIGLYPYDTTAPANAWYRPHQNCKMRFLNVQYCAVCKQTIIERIHALSNPIDDYMPDNSAAYSYTSALQWFVTKLLKPNPNTLKSSWELDGVTLANNVDSVSLAANAMPPGNHSLLFTVTDTIKFSRDTAHHTLHTYSILWSLDNSITTGIQNISTQMEFSMFPNPASDQLNLNYTLLADAEVSVSVIDMNGRTLLREKPRRQAAGGYTKAIDVSGFSAGNYVLAIKINDKTINNQFVIFK